MRSRWFLLSLALAGCSEGNPYTQLDTFRVLAVRSDLPDIQEGQTATLDAAVFVPSDEPVTYAWSWCPWSSGIEEGLACPITDDDAAMLGLSLDLGSEPTATLAFPGTAAEVVALCESFLEGVPPGAAIYFPDCSERMPVTVTVVASAGKQTITTVKTVGLRVSGAPNRNPALGVVTADDVALDDADLAPKTTYDLALTLDEGAEIYVGEDEDGAPLDRTELLTFTWFVEGGETDAGRTGTTDGGKGLQAALQNTWTTPKDDGEDLAVVVVVRDDRGGVDWHEHAVRLDGGAR